MTLVNLPCRGNPRYYNPEHIVSVFEADAAVMGCRVKETALVMSNVRCDDPYLMTDLTLDEAVKRINKALKGTK